MLIPPDSPSLFSHPLVRCWDYLCLPGSIIYWQGFAFHLWAPNCVFQTFLLNFKNHSSSCYPGSLDISTLISIKFNRCPQKSIPPLHCSTLLPNLILSHSPHFLSCYHCVNNQSQELSLGPILGFIPHNFPLLVSLTHTFAPSNYLCWLSGFYSCNGHSLASPSSPPSCKPLREWPCLYPAYKPPATLFCLQNTIPIAQPGM